jgi:hypothetical protein
MLRLSAFALVICMIICLPPAYAYEIADPESVSYMEAEVTQTGTLELRSLSGAASANELKLSIYVPQNDSRQTSRITRVIGPGSYSMSQDEYGNTQIVMVWKTPVLDTELDYLVEASVEVRDVSSGETRNFPVTELVKPSKGIIDAAYNVGPGEKSIKRALEVGAWVYGNVKYDLSCEQETFAASWVFDEGRGTCDEFANLMVSMLKVLGYDAWYNAGYAYVGGKQEGATTSFGAHAWVELSMGGVTYSVDPTWAESPVDATHITMARLPDSNFTEHTEAMSRNVQIVWEKGETRLELIDYSEDSRIDMELSGVPEKVPGGKSALILADVSAPGCFLTNVRIASCVDSGGKSLLGIDEGKMPMSFCDSGRFYWTASAPVVEHGKMLTCPVNLAAGGGSARAVLTLEHAASSDTALSVSTSKVAVPGQTIGVVARLSNSGYSSQELRVFAILGDDIQEKSLSVPAGSSSSASFDLTAPVAEGKHTLKVFASSGDLATEGIDVIRERQIKITEIGIPEQMNVGETATINVTLTNFGVETEASVKLQAGGSESSKKVYMAKDGTGVVGFSFEAETGGDNNVIISAMDSSGAYQDGWSGGIEVANPLSMKGGIAKKIENFFLWLIEAIRSLFGL